MSEQRAMTGTVGIPCHACGTTTLHHVQYEENHRLHLVCPGCNRPVVFDLEERREPIQESIH